MKPVVIVGGGLSGLAAGVGLSARGFPVVLLEQRPVPGGRAVSFTDDTTGEVIDNGQHVLIAGYHRTMRFLETIGTRSLLAVQEHPALVLHHPDRGFRTFRLPVLPSPLHLAAGIATSGLFSPGDTLRMMRAGAALAAFRDEAPGRTASMTVGEWLDAAGQSPETRRSFWEPLAVSIMNEHCASASALVFIRSLRTAFLQGRRNAAIALPTVGLSALYVDAAVAAITRTGGEVRCGQDVVATKTDDNGVEAVQLRDGTTVPCAALILAVPPMKAAALLPDDLRAAGLLAGMAAAPSSPIVSVHLWYASDFMPHDFCGVIGRRVQWVFNRRKICRAPAPGGHLSAVISAARDELTMTNDELTHAAARDLASVYGPAAGSPVHAVVIREKRATFACTPAVERMRPGAQTPVRNLLLAGDWTATGLPATIEGAIMSGERCVDLAAALLAGPP